MGLIATNGKYIKINLWQRLINILIDYYLVNNAKCFHEINTLFGRVENICIRFGLQDAISVLDGYDKIVTQLFSIFKETKMAKVEIVEDAYSNYFFHFLSPRIKKNEIFNTKS